MAGALAGLFGIGGGLLFVPTLVWLGLGQLEAEATSLLAILPTVAAGAWRQHRYGNLRPRAAVVIGLSSVAAVEAGVLVAKALPESTLQTLFALLLLGVAAQLAWRSRRPPSMLRRWPSRKSLASARRRADRQHRREAPGRRPRDRAAHRVPRRILAFRTFAYIRVGVKLGELLVEHDVPPYDGSESWIELLLRDPAHRAAVAHEVRAVAEEIAADPRYREEEEFGPDDAARARFREFARKQLDDA